MTISLKSGFEVRDVCGEHLVMAMGEKNLDFTNVILLNETSLLVWNELEKGEKTDEQLTSCILEEYEVDHDTALHDVQALCKRLGEIGALNCEE